MAYVVVAVRVNESTVTVVDVVLELPFVDDVVDLFSYTGHFSVVAKLSNYILIVLALTESEGLINGLPGVGDDLFKSEGTKLVPFVLGGLQSNSLRICSHILIGIVVLQRGLWRHLLLWLTVEALWGHISHISYLSRGGIA